MGAEPSAPSGAERRLQSSNYGPAYDQVGSEAARGFLYLPENIPCHLPALHVLIPFMSAAPKAPDPPTPPTRSGHLLELVHKLIDYCRELAATIRRRAFTDPTSVICCFGTADVALILARITRGLLRADALEARLIRSADRLDAAPPAAPSQPRPRAPRPPAAPAAAETDPRLARLPTPAQIAAEVRRRPIGAVIADICRDLGIMPSDPLWRDLSLVIIRHGGSLARLVKDILDQAFPLAAAARRRSQVPPPRFPAPVPTGPP
jgi:hypothetical protein